MSGFADARRAIENLFLGATLGAPVYVENMRRPTSAGNPPPAWIALTVGEEAHPNPRTNRLSLGPTPIRRYLGTVVAQVFTVVGKGGEPSDDICDAISALVQEVALAAGSWTIRLGSAEKLVVGQAEAWWQVNVMIPYDRTMVG